MFRVSSQCVINRDVPDCNF